MNAEESFREISMPEQSAGMRFDSAVAEALGLSRSAVEDVFERGGCTWAIDGAAVKKSDRVKVGDKVKISLLEKNSTFRIRTSSTLVPRL